MNHPSLNILILLSYYCKEFEVLGLKVAIVIIFMIICNNNKAFGFLFENFPLDHWCRGRSRGGVQGRDTSPTPHKMTCGFLKYGVF